MLKKTCETSLKRGDQCLIFPQTLEQRLPSNVFFFFWGTVLPNSYTLFYDENFQRAVFTLRDRTKLNFFSLGAKVTFLLLICTLLALSLVPQFSAGGSCSDSLFPWISNLHQKSPRESSSLATPMSVQRGSDVMKNLYWLKLNYKCLFTVMLVHKTSSFVNVNFEIKFLYYCTFHILSCIYIYLCVCILKLWRNYSDMALFYIYMYKYIYSSLNIIMRKSHKFRSK